MRVLIVTQYFWPEDFRINALVRALGACGRQVTVLTGKPNYPDGQVFPGYAAWGTRREHCGDAEVVRVPLVPRGRKSSVRLTLNYLSFIVSGYLVAPFLLRRQSVDAVFVYAPSPLLQALPALFLAWLKRAPLVVWVQDLWPESLAATGFVRNRWVLVGVEWLVRHIYSHVDLILIQSEGFRAPVARLVRDTRKIRYFPNAVETTDVSAATTSAEVGALAKDIAQGFSVVFTGNLGTAQSFETIIDAAEQLRAYEDIRFFLIGSGSRSDWLKAETARRGLHNFVRPGRFPPPAMAPLHAASAALLPHRLSRMCELIGARLVHVSTDCVPLICFRRCGTGCSALRLSCSGYGCRYAASTRTRPAQLRLVRNLSALAMSRRAWPHE